MILYPLWPYFCKNRFVMLWNWNSFFSMDSQYFRGCFADIKPASYADSIHDVRFWKFQNIDKSVSDDHTCLFPEIALGMPYRINHFDSMIPILSGSFLFIPHFFQILKIEMEWFIGESRSQRTQSTCFQKKRFVLFFIGRWKIENFISKTLGWNERTFVDVSKKWTFFSFFLQLENGKFYFKNTRLKWVNHVNMFPKNEPFDFSSTWKSKILFQKHSAELSD